MALIPKVQNVIRCVLFLQTSLKSGGLGQKYIDSYRDMDLNP